MAEYLSLCPRTLGLLRHQESATAVEDWGVNMNAQSNPLPLQLKTVLVVGPDNVLAATVSSILPDWNIERAANNCAALEMIESQPYDLVLTGENTSGKDDVELLHKIRLVRPHTRLIILSNESTPVDVIASMRERAFSYFSKPFSQTSFAEMLQLAAHGPCWDDGIEVVAATPAWIQLIARCDRNTADRLLQFFHEISDLPESERDGVAMAFREMLLNAIEHGGHFDPGQFVEISYIRAQHAIMCRVKDPGEGFSLEEIQHAAIANPPDDPIRHQSYRDAQGLRPGGFGVLLSRSFVDELIYSEKGNDVILVKYLDFAQLSQKP
jgi:anti-sigma regulatory factor (Ser/Thr protein kinase)/DNA-binding NarL/FixJ family response regulator